MTSDKSRRVISPKACWIAEAGNGLASRGSAIWVEAIRHGLTRRGLCTKEVGNQSIGDVLGKSGFGLPSESWLFLRFEAPDAPGPPGWRRVSYIEDPEGLIPYVRSRRCYTWPPPPGIDRAFLAERFVVPSNWDWTKYDL